MFIWFFKVQNYCYRWDCAIPFFEVLDEKTIPIYGDKIILNKGKILMNVKIDIVIKLLYV